MPLRPAVDIPIPIAAPPPGPAVAALPMLAVPYMAQEQTEWCWAACAQMVAAFLNKPPVQQCELANFLHQQTICCANPAAAACNQPCPIEGFNPLYAHLAINCITNTFRVGAAVVLNELQNNRPVEVGLLWLGGGGHVVLIRGVTPQGLYAVNDPYFGRLVCTYNFLALAYGRGLWGLTFGDFQ